MLILSRHASILADWAHIRHHASASIDLRDLGLLRAGVMSSSTVTTAPAAATAPLTATNACVE
jgi:hypothetical protein